MSKIRKPSKSGQDRHLPGDPKNGQKHQNANFQDFKNSTPRSEAAPGTNRSKAGTAKQKPQGHCVAKLSEEVRNHKPCESRVAQHYGPAQVEERKKGRAGDACF